MDANCLLGERQSVALPNRRPRRKLVFSGAFNPLHDGHRRMVEIAADRCSAPVVMELSIANVDKPTLDFLEIADRLAALGDFPVLLTRAPTFVEKAARRAGRHVRRRRRHDRPHRRRKILRRQPSKNATPRSPAIAARGCRFLVFGRAVDGRFVLPSELNLPRQLRELCDEVRESEFRCDISLHRIARPQLE